jgi:hypothetical protein
MILLFRWIVSGAAIPVPPPITWTPEKGYGVVGLGCKLPT